MQDSPSATRALAYLLLAQQFLDTAHAILEQMIACGNPWILVEDFDISSEHYRAATRWSDFNTMLPTLFLFFHGSELLVKGILKVADGKAVPSNHNIDDLLRRIPGQHPCSQVRRSLEKYVLLCDQTPAFLQHYREGNKLITSPYRLYESVRYPESRERIAFDHSFLRHNSDRIVAEIRQLADDIDLILKIASRCYSGDRQARCTDPAA